MGFFKGLKKVVSAPVQIAKSVGSGVKTVAKKGWSGVKTTGKALASPKGLGAVTSGVGAVTGNPQLISQGIGVISDDYIAQQRYKNAKEMAKSLNSATLEEAQNLEALFKTDTALAGLQLESALAGSDTVQTVTDIPEQDQTKLLATQFIKPVIGIAVIGGLAYAIGKRFSK
jgi:hypothetical protein